MRKNFLNAITSWGGVGCGNNFIKKYVKIRKPLKSFGE
jgi:hypothetical protein